METEISSGQAGLHSLAKAYWFWKAFDEIELRRIRDSGGKLDNAAVSRIGRWYSVARTLPGKKKARAAEVVNKLPKNLQGKSLVERAERCVQAAEQINKDHQPRSAVSKLLWFLAPTGWTMYDQYAARGAGVTQTSAGSKDFVKFYERLQASGFESAVNDIRKTLVAEGFESFPAERVIDWELMRRCEKPRSPEFMPAELAAWTPAYLETLHRDTAAALKRAACGIEKNLNNFRPESVT